MRRRDFLSKSFQGVALLSGIQPFIGIPAWHYKKIIDQGIETRFAIASDGHYGQADTPFEDYHRDMMSWLNKEHERHKLDFALFNGDLIHDEPTFLPSVKQKFDTLNMPYYVSRGNHDRCDALTWNQTWNRDLNYSFEIGRNAFVVLDTSNTKGEYLCPDLDWMQECFRKYSRAENIFVFMHITPRKWTGAGINCKKVVKFFSRQKNLKAIFHGHDHDQDDVKIAMGKHYFFDSHLGGNWGTDYRGYRVVEITPSNEILTYQVNPAGGTRVNSLSLAGAEMRIQG